MSFSLDHAMPDVTVLPPAHLLPVEILPLQEARDAAYERWDDFYTEHHALLSSNWEATYESRDIVAAAEAVQTGKDPMRVKSALAEARDRRPRVIGAYQELAKAVRTTDKALVTAWRQHVGSLAPVAAQRMTETAAAYEEAHRALLAARAAFGEATLFRSYVHDWQGDGRTDFHSGGANPHRADGLPITSDIGAGEVREVMESFRAAGYSDDGSADAPNPAVLVKVRGANGVAIELAATQAYALVSASNNDVAYDSPADEAAVNHTLGLATARTAG
ncbi:hypothetical protein AB0N87_28350 [Streptomyces sp. NPDC093228]|uniref:hypothetical protein n=1 Tax=Streptomyces sp. NPDC093228 TaxID=3155070 RepID=UPI0034242D72